MKDDDVKVTRAPQPASVAIELNLVSGVSVRASNVIADGVHPAAILTMHHGEKQTHYVFSLDMLRPIADAMYEIVVKEGVMPE